MKRTIRFASSLLLSGALLAPIAMQPQDRDHDRDDRIYDRWHHDYHQWTPDEDRYYHQWYGDRYRDRDYRDYRRMSHRDQERYWNWRHDHDRDRDHDHDRDHDRH